MAAFQSIEVFEWTYQRVALQHMLVLLAEHGVPKERLINYCLTIAEMARTADTTPEVRAHADKVALQYEDMANTLLGGGLLSRDPKN